MFNNKRVKELERQVYELQKKVEDIKEHIVCYKDFNIGETLCFETFYNPNDRNETFTTTTDIDSNKYYIDEVLRGLLEKLGYELIPVAKQPEKPATFKLEKKSKKKPKGGD